MTTAARDGRSPSPRPAALPAILAIDDDENFLWLMGQALEGRARMTLCRDAGCAVEAVVRARPHLILLDLGLTGISGETLIPALLRSSPASALVILSANQDVSGAVRCLHAGARDYLTKDQPKGVLLERILAIAQDMTSMGTSSLRDSGRLRCALAAATSLPDPVQVRCLIIEEALRRSAGNCSAAARLLGMTPQAVSAHQRKWRA